MESVAAAFGHEVIYLAARRGQHLTGVLPLACVRSIIGGTMLVSVPYAVYGGPVTTDPEAPAALLRAVREQADRAGASYIEFRSEQAAFAGLRRIDRYVTFKRELPPSPADVPGWLPRKARAAARNAAKKFGLSVRFDDRQLRQVWRLYALSMRRLGSLNYPYRFFEELLARIRAVLRRHSSAGSNVLNFADLTLDLISHKVIRGGKVTLIIIQGV